MLTVKSTNGKQLYDQPPSDFINPMTGSWSLTYTTTLWPSLYTMWNEFIIQNMKLLRSRHSIWVNGKHGETSCYLWKLLSSHHKIKCKWRLQYGLVLHLGELRIPRILFGDGRLKSSYNSNCRSKSADIYMKQAVFTFIVNFYSFTVIILFCKHCSLLRKWRPTSMTRRRRPSIAVVYYIIIHDHTTISTTVIDEVLLENSK